MSSCLHRHFCWFDPDGGFLCQGDMFWICFVNLKAWLCKRPFTTGLMSLFGFTPKSSTKTSNQWPYGPKRKAFWKQIYTDLDVSQTSQRHDLAEAAKTSQVLCDLHRRVCAGDCTLYDLGSEWTDPGAFQRDTLSTSWEIPI